MHSKQLDLQMSVSPNILGDERQIAKDAMKMARDAKDVKVRILGDHNYEEQLAAHIKNPTNSGFDFLSISELAAM